MIQYTQPAGNQVGDVQFSIVDKWASIVDPDQLGDVSFGIGNAKQGAEGQVRAGCSRSVHVVLFAARRLAALKFAAVPTGFGSPNSDGLKGLVDMSYKWGFETLGVPGTSKAPIGGLPRS